MSRFVSTVSGPPIRRPDAPPRPEHTSTVNITTANGSSITITGSHIELEVQNLSPGHTIPRRKPSFNRQIVAKDIEADDDGKTTVEWEQNQGTRRIEPEKKPHPPSYQVTGRSFPGGPGHVTPDTQSARSHIDNVRGAQLYRKVSTEDKQRGQGSNAHPEPRAAQSGEKPGTRQEAAGPRREDPSTDGPRSYQPTARVSNTPPQPHKLTQSGTFKPGSESHVFPSQPSLHQTPVVASQPQRPAATPIAIPRPNTSSNASVDQADRLSHSGSFRQRSSRFGDTTPDQIPPIVSTPPIFRRASLNPSVHARSESGGYFLVQSELPRPPSPFEREETVVGFPVNAGGTPAASTRQVKDELTSDDKSTVLAWKKPLPPSEPSAASISTTTPRPGIAKDDSTSDEKSTVSALKKSPLPSEPRAASTATATPHAGLSAPIEKSRDASMADETLSTASIWRTKMLPPSESQSTRAQSVAQTPSLPVPIEFRAPPARSVAATEKSRTTSASERPTEPAKPTQSQANFTASGKYAVRAAQSNTPSQYSQASQQAHLFRLPTSAASSNRADTINGDNNKTLKAMSSPVQSGSGVWGQRGPAQTVPIQHSGRFSPPAPAAAPTQSFEQSQARHASSPSTVVRERTPRGPELDTASVRSKQPSPWPQSLLPTPVNTPPRPNDEYSDGIEKENEASTNLLGLFGVGPSPGPSLHRKASKIGDSGSVAPSTPPSTPRMMAMRSVPI